MIAPGENPPSDATEKAAQVPTIRLNQAPIPERDLEDAPERELLVALTDLLDSFSAEVESHAQLLEDDTREKRIKKKQQLLMARTIKVAFQVLDEDWLGGDPIKSIETTRQHPDHKRNKALFLGERDQHPGLLARIVFEDDTHADITISGGLPRQVAISDLRGGDRTLQRSHVVTTDRQVDKPITFSVSLFDDMGEALSLSFEYSCWGNGRRRDVKLTELRFNNGENNAIILQQMPTPLSHFTRQNLFSPDKKPQIIGSYALRKIGQTIDFCLQELTRKTPEKKITSREPLQPIP